jgi:HEAT repeat protein
MKLGRLIAAGLLLLLAGIVLAAPAADPEYDKAMDLLDDREYQKAYDAFESYIKGGGVKPDAALYWQARAMYKLGRKDRALERVNQLLEKYPKSEWKDDAKALMVEMRGEKADPDQLDDAELKMLALQSVMRNDPARAIASIRKMIANTDDERILDQAMFVLAQSGDDAAWKLLQEVAQDESRPEVARAAVQQIAIHGGSGSSDMLYDLYKRTKDSRMREAIINGFQIHGDADKVFEIARTETDLDLRERAINTLGVMGADRELEQIYKSESSARMRRTVVSAYMVSGETRKLLDVAKTDPDSSVREQAISMLGAQGATEELEQLFDTSKDPNVREALVSAMMVSGNRTGLLKIAREDPDEDVRHQAIQMLGVMGASDELDQLRKGNPSRETLEAICTAYMVQGNAKGLIEIYRTSKDSEVRKTAVQQLAVMNSEEALDFMLEILGEDK